MEYLLIKYKNNVPIRVLLCADSSKLYVLREVKERKVKMFPEYTYVIAINTSEYETIPVDSDPLNYYRKVG